MIYCLAFGYKWQEDWEVLNKLDEQTYLQSSQAWWVHKFGYSGIRQWADTVALDWLNWPTTDYLEVWQQNQMQEDWQKLNLWDGWGGSTLTLAFSDTNVYT